MLLSLPSRGIGAAYSRTPAAMGGLARKTRGELVAAVRRVARAAGTTTVCRGPPVRIAPRGAKPPRSPRRALHSGGRARTPPSGSTHLHSTRRRLGRGGQPSRGFLTDPIKLTIVRKGLRGLRVSPKRLPRRRAADHQRHETRSSTSAAPRAASIERAAVGRPRRSSTPLRIEVDLHAPARAHRDELLAMWSEQRRTSRRSASLAHSTRGALGEDNHTRPDFFQERTATPRRAHTRAGAGQPARWRRAARGELARPHRAVRPAELEMAQR